MAKAKPSKSAKKREYLELQQLGEQLIDLAAEQLSELQLDEALLAAILDAKSITSHGALRRQKQLIGKLMRNAAEQPIRQWLDEFHRQERTDKANFRQAEAWRDRIAGEGKVALQAFYAETGEADAELDALVNELGATTHDAGRRQIRRRLFRALHDRLSGGMQKRPQ